MKRISSTKELLDLYARELPHSIDFSYKLDRDYRLMGQFKLWCLDNIGPGLINDEYRPGNGNWDYCGHVFYFRNLNDAIRMKLILG